MIKNRAVRRIVQPIIAMLFAWNSEMITMKYYNDSVVTLIKR